MRLRKRTEKRPTNRTRAPRVIWYIDAATKRRPTFIRVVPAMSQHAGMARRTIFHPVRDFLSSVVFEMRGLRAGEASEMAEWDESGRWSSASSNASDVLSVGRG